MTRLANGQAYQYRLPSGDPFGQEKPDEIRHYEVSAGFMYRDSSRTAAEHNRRVFLKNLALGRTLDLTDELWTTPFVWPKIAVGGVADQLVTGGIKGNGNHLYFLPPPVSTVNIPPDKLAKPSIVIDGRSAAYESTYQARVWIERLRIVGAGGIYLFGVGKEAFLRDLVVIGQDGTAIEVDDCHSLKLADIHARQSKRGIHVHDSNKVTLDHCYAKANGFGVLAERVTGLYGDVTSEGNEVNFQIEYEHDSWLHGHAEVGRNIMRHSRGHFIGNGMRFKMDDYSWLWRYGKPYSAFPDKPLHYTDPKHAGKWRAGPGWVVTSTGLGGDWIRLAQTNLDGFYRATFDVSGDCDVKLSDDTEVPDWQGFNVAEGLQRHTLYGECRSGIVNLFVYPRGPCNVQLISFDCIDN